MIIQGIMMNFNYDQETTIASLQQLNFLDDTFNYILTQVSTMEKDFEIKRLIIGLSALALGEKSHQLD